MSALYPLTSEQIEIQALACDFANREILPVRNLYEKDISAQNKVIEKICHSGLTNTRIPEEFGGLGLSLLDTCLIIEELAFAGGGIASLAQASELAITYILAAGSLEQKTQFLKPLAEEGSLAGIAPLNCLGKHFVDQSPKKLSKPLTATEEAGKILINGYCPLLLNAHIAKWFLIACPLIQDKNTVCNDGITYFIIANDNDIEGLAILDPVEHIGCLGTDAHAVSFENVSLDSIARLDMNKSNLHHNIAPGDASNIFNCINTAIISSGCLGLANAAFVEARKYAGQRKTFGAPIAKHQVISFMLADMSTDIAALRLMILQLIKSIGLGCHNKKLAASAQTFALEMIARIAADAVQIFGGYGYTKEYPVEKLMRDAKAYQAFYGAQKNGKEELGKSLI